jgi:hypothetical protein
LTEPGYLEHVLKPDGGHFSSLVTIAGLASPSIADFPDAYAEYAAPVGPLTRDTATEVVPS